MNEGTGNISKRSGLISEITEANLQYIADRIGTKVPEHINNTDIHVTTDEKAVWNEKQDKLTFDDTPTAESSNPVKSGGVYAALDTKADKATTLSGYGITNAYTKTEADTALEAKADKSTTLAGYGITDAYTKTETDTALSIKADKTYVNTSLAEKADKATTLSGYGITDAYTKTEVNTALNEKAGKATTLAGYGITDAYTKTDMDDALDTKADKADGKGLSANDLTDELKMGYDEATLLAMYNRSDVTPSPEEWFMIDESTHAVSINTEIFNNLGVVSRIVIPWKIGNVLVYAIDTEFANMCDDMDKISEIVIPNSVYSIRYNAFYSETWGSMSGLKRINIPTSLTYIGTYAFKNCTALSDIDVPAGAMISSCQESAFEGCTSLKNIDSLLRRMPNALYFDKRIFKKCSGISTVIIPENVNSLAKSMFVNTNIDCVTILNKNCNLTNDPFAIVQSGISDDDFDIPTYPALIKGYKGSTAETFANENYIPFMSIEGTEVNAKADKAITLIGYGITDAYTKTEADAALAAKADKTAITANADGSITLSDNTEFRVADTVTSISLTVPTGVSDDFISSVVFKSGATATIISVIGTAKWCGDSVADGEFTPVANRVYNIVFYNDGFNVVGIVGGYSS